MLQLQEDDGLFLRVAWAEAAARREESRPRLRIGVWVRLSNGRAKEVRGKIVGGPIDYKGEDLPRWKVKVYGRKRATWWSQKNLSVE